MSDVPDGFAERIRDEQGGEIRLLKLPYPYRAALTVCSDTHATPVPTFEAVHTLINTRQVIERGSDAWSRLFQDRAIDEREAWSQGIQGFGLPIADTMWLYSPQIGVFETFDESQGQPVPHSFEGQDFREIVDQWLRRGWVDALHTPGPGSISRKATAAGLEWLRRRPHGQLKVWVNHSLDKTPTCLEPDEAALLPVVKNIVKSLMMPLSWVGLGFLGSRLFQQPKPRKFPAQQRGLLWLLSLVCGGSIAWLLLSVIAGSVRGPLNVAVSSAVFAASVIALGQMRLSYGQGDNPGSPYYNADLVRDFGFRYFWLINSLPGYQTHVSDGLALPEQSSGGRPSCLRLVRLDDGERVLAFGRVYKKSVNAWASIELVTPEALDKLCAEQGTSILYTHWTHYPQWVFGARALDSLEHLRRYHDDGRVWVAPISAILHYTFVRAFLRYSVRLENGTRIVDIAGVEDPVEGLFVPTLEDLRGISFACSPGPTEFWLHGKAVDKNALDVVPSGDAVIARFR